MDRRTQRGHHSGGTDAAGRPRWFLPAIVAAQLLATSMWFAPNAVMPALQAHWDVPGGVGWVTAAVQLGFIAGTLVNALLAVADRFHPGRVFLVAALAGASANAAVIPLADQAVAVVVARFVVGVCLAGIYPVGMKIAAGWYREGLGRALGFLVGALVLGTASGHLLRSVLPGALWPLVIAATSLAGVVAGAVMALAPEGPHLARSGPVRFGGVFLAFRSPAFRASAFGYFGHMWELYAFWAFAPVWFAAHGSDPRAIPLLAFGVIAMGALGCAGGGLMARRWGSGRVAWVQLLVSGVCCALSPLIFQAGPTAFVGILLVWGIAVAGDSPQFSTLNAANAPRELVGSALTLVNSVGFAISIVTLGLLDWLQFVLPARYLLTPLVIGPLLGLIAARRLLRPAA
ncbi:MFS transporter [Arhodomonas aquaeolei]|uniref:MFS transporter n=1 Tax=Arhodomonas aquaeolei TaxID=2369 RepID=UPI002169A20E|nr:MFS transporter [Arhodomonas aquaeolei]MCS4502686.1 MFS transporter [Arhodomonas aquaeolei]